MGSIENKLSKECFSEKHPRSDPDFSKSEKVVTDFEILRVY